MAEINVNLAFLEICISKLNALASEWGGRDLTEPTMTGGGKTANELEKMVKLYKDINAQMVTLATNTASFMSNVKETYLKADDAAAKIADLIGASWGGAS